MGGAKARVAARWAAQEETQEAEGLGEVAVVVTVVMAALAALAVVRAKAEGWEAEMVVAG